MELKVIYAKSTDDAIKQLLDSTNADRNSIKVTVKQNPTKGLFGLGAKDGIYELSYDLVKEDSSENVIIEYEVENNKVEDIDDEIESVIVDSEEIDSTDYTEKEIEIAKEFINNLLVNADINADVSVNLEGDLIKVNIMGDEASCLIGRRGDTLDSIQFLVGLALNKVNKNSHTRVFVDIENYRSKREESLKRYCYKAAREVAKTKKTKKLDYMNPYERRIIHSALQNDRYVITYSEGTDPYRRVVIEYKK